MGFSNSKRLVACMLLMVAVSNAVDQPVKDSPSEVSARTVCSGKCLELRVASLEDQVQRMQKTCCIKEHCTVDLAAYGYDDLKKYGYVRTSGGSSNENYTPVQIDKYRGVTLFELDLKTCTTRNRQRFDTWLVAADGRKLVSTLESAATGTIIIGVTADSVETYMSGIAFQNSGGFAFFTRYNMNLTGLRWRDKFAFIMQKGYPHKTIFQIKPRLAESIQMKIMLLGANSDVTFKQV